MGAIGSFGNWPRWRCQFIPTCLPRSWCLTRLQAFAAPLDELYKGLPNFPASLIDLAKDLIKIMETFEQKLLTLPPPGARNTVQQFYELRGAMFEAVAGSVRDMMAGRAKTVEIGRWYELKKRHLEEQLEDLKDRELEKEFEDWAIGPDNNVSSVHPSMSLMMKIDKAFSLTPHRAHLFTNSPSLRRVLKRR